MDTFVDRFQLDQKTTVLALVDFQEKMIPAIPAEIATNGVKNATLLAQGARLFNIPILLTEQYPRGLGPTVPELRQVIPDITPIEKVIFSSYRVPEFRQVLERLQLKQVLLCGIEAHICVLQTALDLLNNGYHVFVVADASCSRTQFNWKTSMHMMREAGAVIGSTEIFLFQLLRGSGTDQFKQISRLVK